MDIAYLCLESTREGSAPHAHVHEIAAGLRRRGHAVDVYEPRYDPSTVPTLATKLGTFFQIQRRLMRGAREADALYVRAHPAALPTLLWARLVGKPVVLELNGPYDDLFDAHPWTRRLAPVLRPLFRRVYDQADAMVVGTEQLGAWVTGEIGHVPLHIIPNGANVELFRPDAEIHYDLPESYVVFFGSLAPWQGLDSVLEALNDPTWPKDLHLVIVGDGAMREEVEMAAENDSRVVYLGRIPYKHVAGVVANSVGGLSAKNYPAGLKAGLSPLKVYETLACGVPVIVTDLPGQADIVHEHRCGLIVEMYSPDQIAEAVARLHVHPEEGAAMGRVGREVVECYHSWDSRAGDTEVALREVVRLESVMA